MKLRIVTRKGWDLLQAELTKYLGFYVARALVTRLKGDHNIQDIVSGLRSAADQIEIIYSAQHKRNESYEEDT